MLTPGQEIAVVVEKPAAGGRMIARSDGQVVFVRGAIPGERVRVHVDRVERQLAFADVIDVLEPSTDRRTSTADPLCGGCLYAHIEYQRQLTTKSQVIHDAFTRVGRVDLAEQVPVAASPERGYRMRARLHVKGGRSGFYREGSHVLCDAAQTGQLLDAALQAVEESVERLAAVDIRAAFVEVSENIPADERALRIESPEAVATGPRALQSLLEVQGITGCTVTSHGTALVAGIPAVGDDLAALTGGRAGSGRLSRRAESFFQANRFLIGDLVGAVMDALGEAEHLIDLYAGVGLFSVPLAACGRRVTAVEADRSSTADLTLNAAPYGRAIQISSGSVEAFVARYTGRSPDAVIVDPPRTGMSQTALAAVTRFRSPRIVYVSCDPPTMARDAGRLIAGGYRLRSLRAFDLFPNTPHVESVGVFEWQTAVGK